MGEELNGCTFPGRMISCAGAARVGDMTETGVTADCAASARAVLPALTRDRIPQSRTTATTANAIAQTSHGLRRPFRTPSSFHGRVGPLVGLGSSVWGNIATPMPRPLTQFRFAPDACVPAGR